MKALLLAVVLLHAPVDTPLHPQKISPTGNHAAQSKAKQQAAQGAALNACKREPYQSPTSKKTAEEDHEYQRWGLLASFVMAIATITLAIYSAIQASAAKSTAKSVQGQAATLDSTLKAIGRQADAMERQEKILKDSVDAAHDNAAAAKAGAQAAAESVAVMKAKDSPRIYVKPKPLEFPSGIIPVLAHVVHYTVRLYGATDADIVESCAEVQTGTPEIFEEQRKPSIPMISLPDVIEAHNPKHELSAFFGKVPRALDDTEIEGIRNGHIRVRFFGFIKYTDVFGDKKGIQFEYIWEHTSLKNLDGSRFAYWSTVKQEKLEW